MSNKKRAKERNRGERERLRLKKAREDMLGEELAEERQEKREAPIVEAEAPQELEKYYDEPIPVVPMSQHPHSFEELDELRDSMEKEEHIRQVTYDVQDLVHGILYDGELSPTEKADRIMDVADEFAERAESMMDDAEEMHKDMDVLQIEAILGSYERHASLFEKGRNWAEDLLKRKLSAKARKRLEDGDFALPEKRKYPIHDKNHVRNALARAAQQIRGGGEGAADAKAALPKIRSAAKKMGIEMGMEKSAILIEKDKNGDWRWIGKPSNNFVDFQNDIMSQAAHQKYAAWLEKNMDLAPVFLSWHTPGTARQNPVDFVMEHEGALIMSGKLTEPEAASLLKMQAQTDLGMSLQGFGLRLDRDDPRVITDYWLYEVSDLPLENAANPFTSLETITKEAGMDKLEYLAQVLGSEEKAKSYLEKTGQAQKELQEAGITSKETDGGQPPVGEPPKAEVPAAPAELDVKEITAQLLQAVNKEFDMEGLSATMAKVQESLEKVNLLEGVIKELQKNKDDELAEKLTPPVAKFSWSIAKRPSNSKENLLTKDEKDEELKKAGPVNWLSEVTHTVPIQE